MYKYKVKIANIYGWSKRYTFSSDTDDYQPQELVALSSEMSHDGHRVIGKIIKRCDNSPIEPTQHIISGATEAEREQYIQHLIQLVTRVSNTPKKEPVQINFDVPIIDGRNARMRINPDITAAQIERLGFTQRRKGTYYLCRTLSNHNGLTITLNISFDVVGYRHLKIDILDETYLQPYDYQAYIKQYAHRIPKLAGNIHIAVQQYMMQLVDEGLLLDYQRNDYI